MRTEENRKNTDKNRKIILGTVCGVMLITTAVAAAKIKVVVSEKNDLASRTNVGLIANELTKIIFLFLSVFFPVFPLVSHFFYLPCFIYFCKNSITNELNSFGFLNK